MGCFPVCRMGHNIAYPRRYAEPATGLFVLVPVHAAIAPVAGSRAALYAG